MARLGNLFAAKPAASPLNQVDLDRAVSFSRVCGLVVLWVFLITRDNVKTR